MKRNKFLALLLTFCCAAGMVACSNDDEAVQGGEDSLLREPMTIFRSYKMGYGESGSGNTEGNVGGTANHYCGVVEGTRNEIQVEWYGVKGCAGYQLRCIVQGRNFENEADRLVDTILGPDVLKLRIEDLQYNCGFRFAIRTLSKRGEGFHSNWNGYGDGSHPNDYLEINTKERYWVPEVFWVENVTKDKMRIRWSLGEQKATDDEGPKYFELNEKNEYVVDKVVVAPTADNPEAPRYEFNFADYKDQGYIDVDNLPQNCSYTVNGFNTKVKRFYDSMYNTINVRMKGDPIDPVVLKWEEWYDQNDVNTRAKELKAARIDTMLANYMTNKEYPEGTIFELEPRKIYYIQNSVSITKGLTLRCTDPNVAPEDRPLVYLGIGWQKKVPNPDPMLAAEIPEVIYGVTKAEADKNGNFAAPCSCNLAFSRNPGVGDMGGINVQDIIIENINFDCDGAYNILNPGPDGKALGNYFINQTSQAMTFTLSSFQLRHCNFRNMVRGFIRFQGPNRKQVERFIIDDCMFYGCGAYDNNGRGYSWITCDGTMPLHNILMDFSWTNSTFVDSPRHAVISENKMGGEWDPSMTWKINFSNNTLINCSTRSNGRLIFEMTKKLPANATLTCKNNLFVTVRKDDSDKRTLYTSGMKVKCNGGTVFQFSDNYAIARPDYTDETMKESEGSGKLTDYLWTGNQFSHTSNGANNKKACGGGNQPLNGGDPAAETKIKLVTSADGKYLTAVDLMEDPNPKSADGEPDMHSNYRGHKLNLDVDVEHRIPDGFKIRPQYKSLLYNEQGEVIGDPRWLK